MSKKRTFPRDVLSFALIALGITAARSSLADHYVVPSGSMMPTVEIGDHVCVDKLAYSVHVPFAKSLAVETHPIARGDVVVLESPDDGIVLLKRVVALPGDRVEVRSGLVHIDGVRIDVDGEASARPVEHLGTPHVLDLEEGGGPDLGPTRVPDGSYLVLGDARGNSRDGRIFGLVRREAIFGRAVSVCLRSGKPAWRGL